MPTRRSFIAALCLTLAPPQPHADEAQILAWTRRQGECDQAMEEARYGRAVAACKQAVGLGEDLEPGLFFDTSLYNLVLAYSRLERYMEAEITLGKLLETRAAAFGAEHPLTVSAMNLMAAIYKKTGREAEAKQLEAQFQRMVANCDGLLAEEAREQIAKGAAVNPCDPLPLPDFLR